MIRLMLNNDTCKFVCSSYYNSYNERNSCFLLLYSANLIPEYLHVTNRGEGGMSLCIRSLFIPLSRL